MMFVRNQWRKLKKRASKTAASRVRILLRALRVMFGRAYVTQRKVGPGRSRRLRVGRKSYRFSDTKKFRIGERVECFLLTTIGGT